MREMSNGDVARAVISHVPAVSCIQLPVLEMIEAIRRSRKMDLRKGSQLEFTCGVCGASAMDQSSNGNIGQICIPEVISPSSRFIAEPSRCRTQFAQPFKSTIWSNSVSVTNPSHRCSGWRNELVAKLGPH